MVVNRVAGRRNRAVQVLVCHLARGYRLRSPGRPGKIAVADRARLSGAQTGTRPGDYEGRGWRGFHHHATLCIAAYGFLIAERGAIPPSGPRVSPQLSGSAIPNGYRPRGAADPTRTPHPKLDRDHATTPHRRSR